jgi:uncharacterized protein HemX
MPNFVCIDRLPVRSNAQGGKRQMEARQNLRAVSIRPLAAVVVVLAVLAVALVGWYATTRTAATGASGVQSVTTRGFQAPDAQERNVKFKQDRNQEIDPEAHHGH